MSAVRPRATYLELLPLPRRPLVLRGLRAQTQTSPQTFPGHKVRRGSFILLLAVSRESLHLALLLARFLELQRLVLLSEGR